MYHIDVEKMALGSVDEKKIKDVIEKRIKDGWEFITASPVNENYFLYFKKGKIKPEHPRDIPPPVRRTINK